MKVAISTENNMVAEHFGRCAQYTIVEIQDGNIKDKQVVDNPGHAPGAIPKFLHDLGCNVIITGGMGRRAQQFFQQYAIECFIGVQGNVVSIIDDFLHNNITMGESTCSHGEGKGTGYRDCEH